MEQKSRAVKIVLHGAQSSGKTTLARQLAAHFGTVWVPEFSRHYLEAKGELDERDVWPILWGQIAWQNALIPEANHLLFCDTDPFSSQVYAAFYYGLQTPQIADFCRAHRGDFYLFCESDLPFESEVGQRDALELQKELRAQMWGILEREGLPFGVVSGVGEGRVLAAIEIAATAPSAPVNLR